MADEKSLTAVIDESATAYINKVNEFKNYWASLTKWVNSLDYCAFTDACVEHEGRYYRLRLTRINDAWLFLGYSSGHHTTPVAKFFKRVEQLSIDDMVGCVHALQMILSLLQRSIVERTSKLEEALVDMQTQCKLIGLDLTKSEDE